MDRDALRVLRVSHSGVVDAWRARERLLTTRGHDVESISARSWREAGAEVPLVARAGERVTGARTWGRHPALFVYDPRPIWRALSRPTDVIDIHEEPFALATAEVLLLRRLRRVRAPYILYSAQNIEKRYPPPFRWIERAALRGASGVSVCNAEAKRIVEAKGLRGAARVIPLGLDLDVFTPDLAARPARGADDRLVRVGFAGRLDEHKGAVHLIEALSLQPALTLKVAGGGPERTGLEALASRLGVSERVDFLGALDPAALPEFYRSVDVLAVPSRTTPSWVEQFGRVALEAMACGTPVVVSDSGALPEVVGDAALVVPEGDSAELADALLRAGADPQTRDRLRAAGLSRAESASWARVTDDYERLYRAVSPPDQGRRPGHAPAGARPGKPAQRHTTSSRGVAVVVVAFGNPELLSRALAPLGGVDVTVIDNSSDARVRAVTERAAATYVDPGRNGGFAAGVNEGLRHVNADSHVLLLNPDASMSADGITALVSALESDPGLASVAPTQIDDAGDHSQVAWPYPSPAGTWLEAIGLGRLRKPRYAIGSVLLLRREAIEEVGPFDDERFFLYAEETDWAYRATRLGWRHAVVSDVTAQHTGAGTSTDPIQRETHFHAGQETFLRKHYGVVGWQVSRVGQILGSTARTIILPADRGAAARRRLGLYVRGPRRVEVRPGRAGGRPTSPATSREGDQP